MNECIPSLSAVFINTTQPWNNFSHNNDHIINYGLVQFGNQFSKIHGPLSLAVCTFGIPANIVNIIVLTRRELAQTATNHLLLWLAVADLLLMILYAPCLYHFYIVHPHPMKNPIFTPSKLWIIYQEIVVSCALMLHSLALWLAVLLALFRYIHVGFPVSSSRYTTRRRALLSALLTTLFCIFVAVPNVLVNHSGSCVGPKMRDSYTPVETLNNKSVQIYYYITSEPDFDELNVKQSSGWRTKQLHNFNVWLQAVITKIAPSFLLTILTILLISELQKAIKRRKILFINRDKSLNIFKKNHTNPSTIPFYNNMNINNTTTNNINININNISNDESKKLSRENRTTGLLLTIVLCFLVIELPQGILVTCIHLIDSFEENVYQHLGDLLDFLTLLNESISFIIYTTMSYQFRQTFCNIFCPFMMKTSTLLPNQQTIIQYRQQYPGQNVITSSLISVKNEKTIQQSLNPDENNDDDNNQCNLLNKNNQL
ncbi:unnamed protein product [Schistosoma turkestanicum]|nr:unnamed protein product [Schistosoma turkestanicum]